MYNPGVTEWLQKSPIISENLATHLKLIQLKDWILTVTGYSLNV